MAIGDDALAAGLPLVNGATTQAKDIDLEINRTRDHVAQEKNARTAADALKVDKPADGAAMARREPGSAHSIGFYTVSDSTLYFRPEPTSGSYDRRVAMYSDIPLAPDLSSRVAKAGDTMTGDLFIPGATAATSGYVIAYMNGDGRLSKGASSERFKKFISAIDPASLGDIWPTFQRFQMRSGDSVWRYGYIAERLAEHPDTEPFVIYERVAETGEDGNVTGSHLARDENGNPVPESIDFIGLLLAQVAQLHQGIDLLARRVEELERGHAAG